MIYHLFPVHQVMVLGICSWMLNLGDGNLIYFTFRGIIPQVLLLLSRYIQIFAICILWMGIERKSTGKIILSGFLIV